MIENYQKNDFNVRVHRIEEQFYFSMADICKNLQIKNSRSAKEMVDAADVISVQIVDADRGYKANFVSEKGLWKIVSKTKSPLARPFQDWLYGDVLPAIRRTGAYAMPGTAMAKYQENLSRAANKAFGILKFRLAQIMYNEFFTAEEMHAAIDDAQLEIAKGMALNYDAARWDCGAPQATRDRLEGYCGEYGEFKRPSRLEAASAEGFLN